MVELSKSNAAKEGVADRATFVKADLFETDFSSATVVTMFLLPDINLKLRPKILDLKPGTRIVSNTFTMGEWKPDQTVTVAGKNNEDCGNYNTALLSIVPAKVEGDWKSAQGELTLKQTFQTFSGTLTSDATTLPVTNGKLRGDLTFNVGDTDYSGRVTREHHARNPLIRWNHRPLERDSQSMNINQRIVLLFHQSRPPGGRLLFIQRWPFRLIDDSDRDSLTPLLSPFESHHPVLRVVSGLIVDFVDPACIPLEGIHVIE